MIYNIRKESYTSLDRSCLTDRKQVLKRLMIILQGISDHRQIIGLLSQRVERNLERDINATFVHNFGPIASRTYFQTKNYSFTNALLFLSLSLSRAYSSLLFTPLLRALYRCSAYKCAWTDWTYYIFKSGEIRFSSLFSLFP